MRQAVLGTAIEPVRLGRFVVLEKLGAGGMGTVYAAFDPRLDRRIALKVMPARAACHPSGPASQSDAGAAVIAEARALAKLSHPNVVAVYDASDLGDELYIAMELVVGQNLRKWLAEKPRTQAVIVAVMISVARGLAAAHAAGLVHGDVKPENILVGDGVVKVADFGLARGVHVASNAGTPGYIAPEQLAGRAADARSDQYAFAVTLREALGKPDARVQRAIDRALAEDPARRFASMEAMIVALTPAQARRWPLAVGAVVVGAAAIAIGRTDEACTTRAPHAALPLSARAAAAFDAYGQRWATFARQTCEATRRGEQSAAMLDLKMACLERRRDELVAVASAAVSASPDVQIRAAYELAPLEPCADRDELAGVLPPPPPLRAAVAAVRGALLRISARQKTTHYRAALADARALAARARALGYGPLTAEVLNLVSKLETQAALYKEADATLALAIAGAAQGRDDALLAELWTTRIFVARARGRAEEALAYGEVAAAQATRVASPFVLAMTRYYVGEVLAGIDRLAEARASLEQALPALEGPRQGEVLTTLADVCGQQGELAAARRYGERAVAVFTAALGANHQDTVVAEAQLASVAMREGDLERALREYRDVLARTIASAGEWHVYTASAHHNVGDALRKLGRIDEARRELGAARAIFEGTTGLEDEQALLTLIAIAKLEPDPAARKQQLEDVLRVEIKAKVANHRLADTFDDIGDAARDAGDAAGAAKMYRAALEAFEASLGPTHPRVAIPLSNLGELAIERRDYEEAARVCARALAIDERALGDKHPDLAYDLTCLGEADLGRGRDGTAQLERALVLRTGPADELARTQFALARAVQKRDPKRAAELARAALPHANHALVPAIESFLHRR